MADAFASCYCFAERGSHSIAQAGLRRKVILLPQAPCPVLGSQVYATLHACDSKLLLSEYQEEPVVAT